MIKYTVQDMMKLVDMSVDASVAAIFLEEFDYSPKKFRGFLEEHHLDQDIRYLYEMPFEDLPLEINNAYFMGYISFRLIIGK